MPHEKCRTAFDHITATSSATTSRLASERLGEVAHPRFGNALRWRCCGRFDTLQVTSRYLYMKLVRRLAALPLLLSFTVGLFALQFGGYRRQRYNDGPNVPSEFYWTRLMYTSAGGSGGFRFFGGGWSRDFPKADNDCLIALRRLTHIHSPSQLNVIDLESDHLFDYPWIYAVNVHTWTFTDEEAKRVHDYLLKGG